jgi:MFS family permease
VSAWRVGVDLTPLKVSAPFRRLYLYGAITVLASQMTNITMIYQLKKLTNSTFDVGVLSAAELVPIIVFGLYGGVLADHLDRRKVMVTCEAGFFVCMVILLVNSRLAHPSVAVLYVIAASSASFGSAQTPSVSSVTQQVVPHEYQRQASTLSMIRSTGSSILGPLIGGLLAASIGPWLVYAIVVICFVLTVLLLVGVRVERLHEPAQSASLASLFEGLHYARQRPDILGTYVVDLIAMTLAYPVAVLAFASDQFHHTYALAVLYCGLPFGAMLASLTSSWTARVAHYGRALIVAASVWGLGIVVLGLSNNLWLAFAGLAIGGAADAMSGIFRITMWNESIPPEVRGRMGGVEVLSYAVGPVVGNFRSGLAASVMGLRASIVAGGLGCSALVSSSTLVLRSLWRFDARSDRNVATVKAQRLEAE